MQAAALLALLALLIVHPDARGQYFGQNKVPWQQRQWRVLESPHFHLHFYPEERELAAQALLLSERAYTRLSAVFGHEMRDPIPLILYSTHGEFSETRAVSGLLGEGTGGVTETLKRRVVVPFNGSYADFDHVLTHEIVHAFQLDILSGGAAGRGLQSLSWSPPEWVMEGLAEYLSIGGVDCNTEMWLRDAVLEGELLSLAQLAYTGDLRVYRYGQALVGHIAENFGDEALGSWFRAVARRRSLERGTAESIGMTIKRLSAEWTDSLRVRYLPELGRGGAARQRAARRLTNHAESLAGIHIIPAVSPDGGQVAYISNETFYTDVYVASALDGSHRKRLIRGQRTETFESLRYLRSSFDWHPDGRLLALGTRSQGREQLVVFDLHEREVECQLDFGFEEVLSPDWSPDGRELVFVGIRGGRTYLCRAAGDGEHIETLTDGVWGVFQPAWSPDGTRIAFITEQGYESITTRQTDSPWHLALLDLADGEIRLLPGQHGKNINPQWFPDGEHLLFVSDRTGISNLFVRELSGGRDYQISDVHTGVSGVTSQSPAASLSDNGRRIVFSVFEEGGWNLYSLHEPLELLAGLAPWEPVPPGPVPSPPDGELAAVELERLRPCVMALLTAQVAGEPRAAEPCVAPDERLCVPAPQSPGEGVALAQLFDRTRDLPDSLISRERPYRSRLSIDFAQAGGLYASGFGMLAQSMLAFSDMLGDKNLYVVADVSGSLSDGTYLLGYSDLGRRPAFSGQIYQYWTGYGYSGLPGYPQGYEQRQIRGVGAGWAHPLSRFRRLEAGVDVIYERYYQYAWEAAAPEAPWDWELSEDYTDTWYTVPEIAWVLDSAIYGPTGPISGRRARLAAYARLGRTNSQGLTLDLRRYFNLRQRYALAWRMVAAGEWGPDRRRLIFGGPYSLRGYTDHPLTGSSIAFMNLEFRFPFIDAFVMAWPLRLYFGGIRGAVFCDLGAAWDEPEEFRVTCCDDNGCRLDDLKASFGFRASVNVGLAILRWDLVRRSTLDAWDGKAKGEFSIGWEF